MARCKNPIPSLKVLDLSGNRKTHIGMKSVIAFIDRNTNIARFSAVHNPIGDDSIQLFSFLNFKQLNIC